MTTAVVELKLCFTEGKSLENFAEEISSKVNELNQQENFKVDVNYCVVRIQKPSLLELVSSGTPPA
jgi:hypothetical protein